MIAIEEARSRLEAEHDRLCRLLGWAEDSLKSHKPLALMESAPESGDAEWADEASETFSQEMDATLRQRFLDDLAGVDAALQRLEAGEYGRCACCGKEIAEERLRALPQTPFCVACGREQEVEG